MNDHFIEICYSKDGGHTFSNWRRMSIGALGEYEKRIRIRRLGRARQICFWIRVSSPVGRDLLGAVASVEGLDG